tara:strand:+ start:959 stop:1642 length:684 start_codon:yes stop_codon:yes gene_type:complete
MISFSDQIKQELRSLENSFLSGSKQPQRIWRGFDARTNTPKFSKVSLQRAVLHEYCQSFGELINISDPLALEVGVEKYSILKRLFNVNRIERMDRDNCIMGNKVDYNQDLVDDSIDSLKNRFDLVICSNTLEHTFDIHDGIKRLFQMCKPGGIVYISMPFLHGLHLDPYDYWRVTPYCMEKLVSKYTSNFLVLKEATKPTFPRLVYSKFRLHGYCLHGVSAFAQKSR